MELAGESKPLNIRKNLWRTLRDISQRYQRPSANLVPILDSFSIDRSKSSTEIINVCEKEGHADDKEIIKIDIFPIDTYDTDEDVVENTQPINSNGEPQILLPPIEVDSSHIAPLEKDDKYLAFDESLNDSTLQITEVDKDEDYMHLQYDVINCENDLKFSWNVINYKKVAEYENVSDVNINVDEVKGESVGNSEDIQSFNNCKGNEHRTSIEKFDELDDSSQNKDLNERESHGGCDLKELLHTESKKRETKILTEEVEYQSRNTLLIQNDPSTLASLTHDEENLSKSTQVCFPPLQDHLKQSSIDNYTATATSIENNKSTSPNFHIPENVSMSDFIPKHDFTIKKNGKLDAETITENLQQFYSSKTRSKTTNDNIFFSISSGRNKEKQSRRNEFYISKYCNNLSKQKSLLNLEKEMKIKLEEAEKTNKNYLMDTGPELILKTVGECLEELSSKSVSYKEILIHISTSVKRAEEQVKVFMRKLRFLQELETMDSHKELFRKDEKLLISSLKQKEKQHQEKYDQEIKTNDKLKAQIEELEKRLREEMVEAQKEREIRLKAESHLMITKIEAGATERKLKALQNGGPEFDPHLLQIAFKKCQEELGRRTRLLQEIKLHHKEVVPREDLEKIVKKYEMLSHAHKKISHAYDVIKKKYDDLVECYETLCEERDKITNENLSLRHCATPRPQWSRVAEHIEGGIQRWHDLSQGRTSDQLLELLLTELSGPSTGTSLSTAEYLTCQGHDDSVPQYLQYEGCVRNKKLTKRDVILFINDVWKQRKKAPIKSCSLAEFLDHYFRERYHLEDIRAEWCYSLADACQRLAHEEEIGLFWGILCGQVQEDIYHYQEKMMENLYYSFKMKDPKNKGFVMREEIWDILEKQFPLKEAEALDEIMTVIQKASHIRDPEIIKYKHLFHQETLKAASGQRLPLSHVLIRQLREEQEKYVSQILNEIKPSAIDVSVVELRRAFTMVDPYIEHVQLDSYMSWVFNTNREGLKEAVPIPLALLGARLQTGLIVRIGRRPEENAV